MNPQLADILARTAAAMAGSPRPYRGAVHVGVDLGTAYTVLVVQQIHLYSGPNLVLNTNYSATEVPVPMGVGPYAARTFLSN